jgi:ABC-type Fe3+/spermidine/putrescine transport system ATPase subunit
MSHIDLRQITKRFGDLAAVDQLSLQVEEGELVVLLGPSGCGKTTCLRLLAGFERPDEGEIHLDGREMATPGRFVPPEKRGISVVFQTYALWPHLSVYKNVAYGLEVRGENAKRIKERVQEVLELVQLGSLGHRAPHELSGGQQQRVALARALVTDPNTLLLDEPLSNLDTRLREEMRFEVKRLHHHLGITTVYVTHDQAEALSLADRVVVMNAGRIEQQGPPELVYRRPRTSYVAQALGSANVLPVSIHGRRDDLVEATGPGGIEVLAQPPLQDPAPTTTGEVIARPGDVRLEPDPSGPGVVDEQLFFGDSIQISVRLDGLHAPLQVTAPPGVGVERGQRVRPVIEPGLGALLAEPSARRVVAPHEVVTK